MLWLSSLRRLRLSTHSIKRHFDHFVGAAAQYASPTVNYFNMKIPPFEGRHNQESLRDALTGVGGVVPSSAP